MQQASFRRRRAIGVTGAEIPELSRITRKGGVIERQGQSCAGAVLDRPAHAVDRGNEPRMIGLAADAERTRQIRRADRQQVDALDRGDLIDPLYARLVAKHGFDAMYMTGAGTSATRLGMPDIGLLTLTEMVDNAARISAVSGLPLIADADNGFGGP